MKSIELIAEVKSVVFVGKDECYAIVELKQEYAGAGAFRILGDFRLAVDREAAIELTTIRYLECTIASPIEKSESEGSQAAEESESEFGEVSRPFLPA